ncbi:hypothetical protein DFH08DRAFT_943869 [Mycena albidolilacea]|uniref:Uncharacterized protein n=1 Tax=Mycena albidolilacea TaxID=1033008 RepID=A0AAD6Z8N7_9AGAR|nr:hypothetical protein DFH08DRAFT_943869 [Mycena albidolilacea]
MWSTFKDGIYRTARTTNRTRHTIGALSTPETVVWQYGNIAVSESSVLVRSIWGTYYTNKCIVGYAVALPNALLLSGSSSHLNPSSFKSPKSATMKNVWLVLQRGEEREELRGGRLWQELAGDEIRHESVDFGLLHHVQVQFLLYGYSWSITVGVPSQILKTLSLKLIFPRFSRQMMTKSRWAQLEECLCACKLTPCAANVHPVASSIYGARLAFWG